MGTRADFYVGITTDAEWLGSIAYDGYPDGIDASILSATTEAEYRARVAAFIASRDHGTKPDDGWAWPWEDSNLTDFAYGFADGAVLANRFGRGWVPWTVADGDPDTDVARQAYNERPDRK